MNPTLNAKIIFLAASLALAGCASPPEPAADLAECVFPDAPTESAPLWVCDSPIEGVELSAVGFAQPSKAGNSFMKQMATADARVQLAATFKTRVQNMIKQYAETTGSADSETVNRVNTSVSKLITNETLVGSRVFRTRTSPSGGLYVLVGLDTANVQQAAKDSIQTSINNDQALWQEFKAKKAHDELAVEISKMQ